VAADLRLDAGSARGNLALLMPAKKPLTELTADIVTAHVSNNPVDSGDLPDLIGKVHEALSSAQSSEAGDAGPGTADVPVSQSVGADHMICLVCGRKLVTLRRHLRTAHGLTPEQYRTRFALPGDYPITAPDYSERRRELAQGMGLGRNRGRRP
jgi:predicted transcriptional regulator